jgi:CsoR family transcriptional regulator, copper-sensing transcriptional repressor
MTAIPSAMSQIRMRRAQLPDVRSRNLEEPSVLGAIDSAGTLAYNLLDNTWGGYQVASKEQDITQRLKKIEGQVKGIQKMIEEKRSCEEVITQVMAARAALDKVAGAIVLTHMDECVAVLPNEEAKAAIGRAIQLIARMPMREPD